LVGIDFRDPRPIYEQIRDGFRRLIVSGALSPGDRIPSVRELAGQLAINPNTIQRAYRELESEGYIFSIPGKGSFAGEHREVDEGRKAVLLKKLGDVLEELLFLGLEAPELKAAVERAAQREGGKK
jgi:GntR family transcriptional regulator